MTTVRLYLAGVFESKERLLPIKRELTTWGFEITSGWLLEPTVETYGLTAIEAVGEGLATHYALRDIGNVRQSDWLIVDTLEPSPRGGREVEVGLAMAWGKPVYVVGPSRNVFHTQAVACYDSWEMAVPRLVNERRIRFDIRI